MNADQLAPLLQKPIDETASVLRKLAGDEVGMVEATRETIRRRNPTFRLREHVVRQLGTALGYRRRTQDEIDRKVIEAVQEMGHITGKMVQLLFDVDGGRASRILGDLIERQILVKTSQQQRGPGVTYGPGARFPARRSARKHASASSRKASTRHGSDQPEQQELFTDEA